jgi:hypothetical protein
VSPAGKGFKAGLFPAEDARITGKLYANLQVDVKRKDRLDGTPVSCYNTRIARPINRGEYGRILRRVMAIIMKGDDMAEQRKTCMLCGQDVESGSICPACSEGVKREALGKQANLKQQAEREIRRQGVNPASTKQPEGG